MKTNRGKCHVTLSSGAQREIRFDNASITSSRSEKLLCIILDSELKLEEHVNKICNVINKKLNSLHRIASHKGIGKRKMLSSALNESQFSYCLLILMFYSRTLNK